jgi:SAM-dependent methyltransferase
MRLEPTVVLDLGANDGLFSVMLASEGVDCVAVDPDEAAIDRLYRFAQRTGCSVRALSLDLDGVSRNGAGIDFDLVLALALVHHLTLAQGLSFQEVARSLARLTTANLIVEFMPNGLGGTPENRRPVPDPLPTWYTLEGFLEALRTSFSSVEVIDYERPSPDSTRVLVMCRGVRPESLGDSTLGQDHSA